MTNHTEALFELIEKSDLTTAEVNALIALMAAQHVDDGKSQAIGEDR